MGSSMFEQFKLTLRQALADTDFRRKNGVFQDDAYLQAYLDRVDSLTEDVAVTLGFGDIISSLGMLIQDTPNSAIKFDTRGFTTTLSAFREGVVDNPRKIWFRDVADSTDRYLISDRVGGVLVLNQEVELLNRFPNFGTDLAGSDEYDDASACCTFSIGGTEYIAITMQSHHVCNIYEYATGAYVSRIGVIDTPDAIAGYLNSPIGVACDETNNLLYILNREGQPAGATLNRGFVVSYDISAIAAPVHAQDLFYYASTGSLLDLEVDTAADIFFENGLIWVTNGNNEVGAVDLSGATSRCVKYIEATGSGYALHSPAQVFVQTTTGGFQYVYIANGAAGLIEKFDRRTLQHLDTFGYRALEDELNALNRMSTDVYGAIGYAQGVVADRVLLDGKETDVLICADSLNKRLHRFNLNAYQVDNFVNFDWLEFSVPVSITGWTVGGDIPTEMVTVHYRMAESEQFREVGCSSGALPSTARIQFRLEVQLDKRKFVRDWFVRELVVHGKQA